MRHERRPFAAQREIDRYTKQQVAKAAAELDRQQTDRLVTATQIIIVPGYRFKLVNGMVTNFHQPKSTLLLLISAFVEGDWHAIYDYALAHDFRFLSYGDSSLLLPHPIGQ